MMEQFQAADTLGKVMLGGGALAALMAVVVLLSLVAKARSTVLRVASVLCLLFADASAVAGLVTTWKARQTVDAGVVDARPAKAERIRREGYIKAGAQAMPVVAIAGVALVLSTLGLRVGGRRRWAEEHETPPMGPAFPTLLYLVGLGTCAVAAYFWQAPLRQRDYDDSGWRVLDMRDALQSLDWQVCLKDTLALDAGSPGKSMSELREVEGSCTKHFVNASVQTDGGAGELRTLMAQPWFDDKNDRALVQQRLDQLAPKKAEEPAKAEKEAPPAPDPAVAEVQAKAAGCFKPKGHKGKAAAPTKLELKISKAGKVLDVQSDSKDAAAKKCLAKALKAVTFAGAEERTVAVPLEVAAH